MRIVALTDIHGSAQMIELLRPVLEQADTVLVTGDITHFGRKDAAENIIAPIRAACANLYAVAGNCDYPEVDAYLTSRDLNLHGRTVLFREMGFTGLGGSLITPFKTPLEYTEDEISRTLSTAYATASPDLPFILVSHQPPYDTGCDRLRSGVHVGSQAVRAFIEKTSPLVCFTGHIHESAGIDTIKNTRIINPGPLTQGHYAWAEIHQDGVMLEIRQVPRRN